MTPNCQCSKNVPRTFCQLRDSTSTLVEQCMIIWEHLKLMSIHQLPSQHFWWSVFLDAAKTTGGNIYRVSAVTIHTKSGTGCSKEVSLWGGSPSLIFLNTIQPLILREKKLQDISLNSSTISWITPDRQATVSEEELCQCSTMKLCVWFGEVKFRAPQGTVLSPFHLRLSVQLSLCSFCSGCMCYWQAGAVLREIICMWTRTEG